MDAYLTQPLPMNEEWKDIIGYEGLYQVSNLGRVKSLFRFSKRKNYVITIQEKLLKILNGPKGYNLIRLSRNGILKTYRLHRLIAQAFIPNPENKPEVNHINGNKKDNCVNNLEWVTSAENMQHAHKNNLASKRFGSNNNNTKLLEKDILYIRAIANKKSVKELAILFNVNVQAIYKIIKKQTWKHI